MNFKALLFILISLLILTSAGFADKGDDGEGLQFLIVPSTNPDPALKALEDSSSLQSAFDAAAGFSGSLVEVGTGVLLLDRTIHIHDFDGTFKGQGMDDTEITDRGAVDPTFVLPVNPDRPRDGLFVIYQTDDKRRHVRVQDLSSAMSDRRLIWFQRPDIWQVLGELPWAQDNAPTPLSTSWTQVKFTGKAHMALFLEGVPNLSTVDGVWGMGMIFGFSSAANWTPIFLAGLNPLGGRHVVENCTFVDLELDFSAYAWGVGIETGYLKDATVIVRNNLFENVGFPLDAKDSSNTRIEYVENIVRGAFNGFELIQGQFSDVPGLGALGITSPEPARVVVARNHIELLEGITSTSGFAAGVYLTDLTNLYDQTSSYFGRGAVDALVEDNEIFIPSPSGFTSGVFAAFLIRPKIVDNHFTSDGNALFGAYLRGSTEALVAGNDISGFAYGIFLDRGAYFLENGALKFFYSEGHKISDNDIQDSEVGVVLVSHTRDNRLQGNEIAGAAVDYLLLGELPFVDGIVFGPASGNRIRFEDAAVTVIDDSSCTNVESCPQLDQDSDGSFDEDPIDGIDNDGDSLIDEDPADFPNLLLDSDDDYDD